jgi:hypothetical protein
MMSCSGVEITAVYGAQTRARELMTVGCVVNALDGRGVVLLKHHGDRDMRAQPPGG